MNSAKSAIATRSFRVRDFLDFGKQYGMDYCFDGLTPTDRGVDSGGSETVVARGRIRELALPSGFRFTGSELEIFHSYRSVSLGHAPLLIVIVIEGHVDLSVGAVRRSLHASEAVSLQLRPEYALEASQPAGQKLRTLTLAFDPACLHRASPESSTLASLLQGIRRPVLGWRVSSALLSQLEHGLDMAVPALQKNLILEGLALQLVGHGLPEEGEFPDRDQNGSARERQRLEAVRQLLEFAPTEEHTLAGLAQHAAMSASSLRSKFRATYGVSVFDYLRQCRLELGKRYLEQGYSVQQAAHRAGYRHATNFATAFRRVFGVSPRALH